MTYLIGQIALFLLLALALGLVVGWLLRGLVASRPNRQREPEPDRIDQPTADPLPPPSEPAAETEDAEQIWP